MGAWSCLPRVVCSSRRLLWLLVPGVLGGVAQQYQHHWRKLQIVIQDLPYKRIRARILTAPYRSSEERVDNQA
jgi:hypothetical protein